MSTFKTTSGDYTITCQGGLGTLTVNANLNVVGNLTYIESSELKIDDPFILVAANNTGVVTDMGMVAQISNTAWAGFRFDSIAMQWQVSPDVYSNGQPIVAYVPISTSDGNAAGSNTQIQFNDDNQFAGSAALTFDKASNTLAVVGNVVAGNVGITGGNVTGAATISAGEFEGNLSGTTISVTSTVTAADIAASGITAAGDVSVGGNVTAANFFGNVSGNIDAAGANTEIQYNDNNILAGSAAFTFDNSANTVTVAGNVALGNLLASADVAVQGNIVSNNTVLAVTLMGNLEASTAAVTGNVTGGNAAISGLVTADQVTVGSVIISSTGNIIAGNVNINDLADPVQNQDAATKVYVDSEISNISQIGNLIIIDTTISAATANADILMEPSGTGQFQIVGTNGVIIPTGNVSQRPDDASIGTLRFNSETQQLEVYDGAQWVAATNSQAVIQNQTIESDGISTQYSLIQDARADGILVTVNGVMQTPDVDYTVPGNGNVIQFTTAPVLADTVQVRYISTVATVSAFVLPVYTVADTGNIAGDTGQLIYVSNGDSGAACVAVFDGVDWRRIALGLPISNI
jgi:hypothetical protein